MMIPHRQPAAVQHHTQSDIFLIYAFVLCGALHQLVPRMSIQPWVVTVIVVVPAVTLPLIR